MIKSRAGLLLEGDVERDVKEGDSGEGGVGVGEDELWDCPVGVLFLRIGDLTINWLQHATI